MNIFFVFRVIMVLEKIMKIQESQENYLERILMISEEKGKVRAIDIATSMNFSKPSVSIAMKKLHENGYIRITKDSYILLTKKGKEIATRIYERHKLLTSILIHLGVPVEIAKEDACRIEHDLSKESFEAIKIYASKFIQ